MNTKKIQGNQHVVSRERPDPSSLEPESHLVHKAPLSLGQAQSREPQGEAGVRAAQWQGSRAGLSPPSSPHTPQLPANVSPSFTNSWGTSDNAHPLTYGAIITDQLLPETMDNFPGCVACPMALPSSHC